VLATFQITSMQNGDVILYLRVWACIQCTQYSIPVVRKLIARPACTQFGLVFNAVRL